MSYQYSEQREQLFTDEGQRRFLEIRDHVEAILAESGAITMDKAICKAMGCNWFAMACVDRLVEIGELLEVPNPHSGWGQSRVFVPVKGGA